MTNTHSTMLFSSAFYPLKRMAATWLLHTLFYVAFLPDSPLPDHLIAKGVELRVCCGPAPHLEVCGTIEALLERRPR